MKEIYKEIKGYENLYQVSNLGNVKSLDRIVKRGNGELNLKGKILKISINTKGRPQIVLSKDGKLKTHRIHILMAVAFLDHKPDGTRKVCVDHIDNCKTNNRLDNLQLINHRQNMTKDRTGSSKYPGVHLKGNKYNVNIRINGKKKWLGSFTDEDEAGETYKKELEKLNE